MTSQKTRLHKFLSSKIKNYTIEDYTKPEIQRNIEEHGVFVEGELITNRLHWVYDWQNIRLNNWPYRNKGDFSKIKIIEETEDYLVLFKPYGLVVQPGSGHQEDNLLFWLIQNYPEQKKILKKSTDLNSKLTPKEKSNGSISAGLVHRLDKNTQGLILVAKSEENLKFFQDQFRQREICKKYLTVLSGKLSKTLLIQSWQNRNQRNPIRQKLFWSQAEAINYDQNYREAISIFRPICTCDEADVTLAEVDIKTGRMHQIRLQAEAVGFPLVNENIYNRKPRLLPGSQSPFDFIKQSLKKEEVVSLPEENQDLIKKIQISSNEVFSTSSTDFQKLRDKIFGKVDYCLLANYLEFRNVEGRRVVYQLHDFQSYFR
jgi:23S rRNA-/tRNA-specific pseudouridylate synthase